MKVRIDGLPPIRRHDTQCNPIARALRSGVLWCLALVSVTLASVAGFAGGSSMKVVDLRCEYAVDPVGIQTPAPRLFWKLTDSRHTRGQRQTAYRVLVATSAALLDSSKPDLWDSGLVAGSETTQIDYSGAALSSSQQVFWKVRTWDKDHRPSEWSARATWTMGVLGVQDWKARWIGAPESVIAPGPSQTNVALPGLPVFRKRFDVQKPIRKALVHVTGLGQYELFLDGVKVGKRVLDPAWSVYEKSVYYSSFDITKPLSKGSHAFAVMLGKGFYNTVGDRRVHGVHATRPLKLILQAHLYYADGSEELVVSDESWKVANGPITHSAILGGEDFDARKLPSDWMTVRFNDAAWAPAMLTDGPGGALMAAESPALSVHRVFEPVLVDEPKPGVFVYDFGQNAAGIPRLTVQGPAGAKVRLIPAEQRKGMAPRRNDGRGLVDQAGVGSPNYWEYTLRGDPGGETWTPQFTYGGFQYVQVGGATIPGRTNPSGKPVVKHLVSLQLRNDSADVGTFTCSDPMFNGADRIVDWAVQANMSHVLTDCPHREKLGWLEVSYLMGTSIAQRYDIAAFYSKVTRDIEDSQSSDGRVPTVAPAYPAFSGGFAYTPEWGAAAVVLPFQLYSIYGDRRLLAARYTCMRRFVDYMEATSKDLVPVAGLGDWYDYGHGKPVGESQFTPVQLSAMATFHRCAMIVGSAAEVLGKADDAKHYRALAARVAASFDTHFLTAPDEYRNSGSPQTANAMAIVSGIVPENRAAPFLDRIVDDLARRGYQQTAGDIGYWYLLESLARNGRSEVIDRMVNRTNMGSYGFILNNRWTSMPEAWDADTGVSMNHCMLGHVQDWFIQHVAGLRPAPGTSGFARAVFEPGEVARINSATASYDSVHGTYRTSWKRESDGGLTLSVRVPVNTTAELLVPCADQSEVREGRRALDKVLGVRVLGSTAGKLRLELGSGDYAFRVAPSGSR